MAVVTLTGTAFNARFELPGSGKPFTIAGAYIVRIADGLIVEHAGVEDAPGMITQICALE